LFPPCDQLFVSPYLSVPVLGHSRTGWLLSSPLDVFNLRFAEFDHHLPNVVGGMLGEL
jgi:hypothetical protein